MTSNLAAVAASALALTGMSANAATVYNVNIGSEDLAGYQGAATENAAAGSTWNAVTTTASTTLDDSTGDNSAGVTIGMTPTAGHAVSFGITIQTEGDPIFETWMKDDGNNAAYSTTFGGLSTAAGTTYDLVVYSGWYWGPEGVHTSQSAGTGLAGTFVINSLQMRSAGEGNVFAGGGLGEDSNSADAAGNTNYARFNGLTPDGSGNITFDFNLAGDLDAPINGFQLIETVPEPSTTALLGLGGLALVLRRRK
jgi:hypothetical protein